jgi:ribonucleoside-diphosphate reductase alpha chain
VPEDIKALYATAFEIDPQWLIEAASRRQKWIDQAQSLNIYMAGASGKKLDDIYKLAWLRGLKTTYYLRTIGATAAEKSTVAPGALNAVSSGAGGGLSALDAAALQAQQMAQETQLANDANPLLLDRQPRLRSLPVTAPTLSACGHDARPPQRGLASGNFGQ